MMKKVLIGIIRFYRKHISPRKAPSCRFNPTCSQYGLEAIERFGALKGGVMTIWRILRCNPFGRGGYDPVPESSVSERFFSEESDSGEFGSERFD